MSPTLTLAPRAITTLSITRGMIAPARLSCPTAFPAPPHAPLPHPKGELYDGRRAEFDRRVSTRRKLRVSLMTDLAPAGSPPPVFILSTPRSGSTLLRYIVDTHPEVCCPSEVNLGVLCEDLYLVVSLTLGQTMPGAASAERERAVLAEVRRIVDGVMSSYAAAKRKPRWCDKSPRNLNHLEILTQVFPDAKYICLYRHAMDVVRSFMERVQDGWMIDLRYYARNHGFRNHYGVYLDSWLEKTEVMMEFERARPDQAFGLKYESLVADPAATLAPMFSFLGLEWDERLLDAVFNTRHDPGPGDQNVAYSKRINADSVGLGANIPRRLIPEKMLDRMNQMLGALGYETVGPDWGAAAPRPARPADHDAGAISSVEEIFETYIPARLSEHRETLQGVDAVYEFILSGDGGAGRRWVVDLRELACRPGPPDGEARCSIAVAPTDLIDMVNGRLNAAKALRQGRLRITGEAELANLLGQVLFTG